MQNWIETLDKDNPDFIGKMEIDCTDENSVILKECDKSVRPCAWIRNRNHKKKLTRLFLSINPGMDYSNQSGTHCNPAIYLCFPEYNEDDGKFFDPRMEYNFNPYSKVFLSCRGDIRKYHGEVSSCHGSFALGPKEKDAAKITNRRIRHLSVFDDLPTNYAYCKKLYGPIKDDLW